MIAVRYALFAAIAAGINLATQFACLRLYAGPGRLAAAIAAGTLAGLVAKYILDKRWIFFDASQGAKAHAERFSLYTFTGAFTTAIFWGTEGAMAFFSESEPARLAGGALGLAIGYITKYHLDRRFVFRGRNV
jgi:putative flippase GtrA